MKFDRQAFMNGIAGFATCCLVVFFLWAVHGFIYDSGYNDGFERGRYVERVCPMALQRHCTVGDNG